MDDVHTCARLGVDAIGLNFWPGSPRYVEMAFAADVVRATSLEVVAVFVDATEETIRSVRERTGIRWVQLHGEESPSMLEALQPHAYKAIGVAGEDDLQTARTFAGARLLLDSRVPGAMPGGTGQVFDWDLAIDLAAERALTLAGGLTPENVAQAVRRVGPDRVDVASGVETAPGIKSADAIARFVDAARGSGARP